MFSKDVLHLWVLTAALVAIGLGYFGMRSLAVPPSFGELGHYRGDSLREQAARPIKVPTRARCLQCHEDQWKNKEKSKHASLSCGSCHGLGLDHVRDCEQARATAKAAGQDVTKIKCASDGVQVTQLRKTCENCHAQMVGRPTKFLQIVPAEHLKEQEADDPTSPKACAQCHQGHDPSEEPEDEEEPAEDDAEVPEAPAAATPSEAAAPSTPTAQPAPQPAGATP